MTYHVLDSHKRAVTRDQHVELPAHDHGVVQLVHDFGQDTEAGHWAVEFIVVVGADQVVRL